jgi:hypothetical protein
MYSLIVDLLSVKYIFDKYIFIFRQYMQLNLRSYFSSNIFSELSIEKKENILGMQHVHST